MPDGETTVEGPPVPDRALLGTPPWEEKKPAKKRKGRKKIIHISEEVLDNALLLFKGDRKAAAAYLKITKQSLHFRLEYYPNLKAKWSGETLAYNQILQNAQQAGMLAEAQINAAYTQTSLVQSEAFKQIQSLKEQIARGERARNEPDNPEAQKYAFQLSAKGEPLEEKLLRDSLAAMMREHRESTQAFMDGALTSARISALRNGKGGGSGRGEPGKGQPAGVGAKRAVVEVKS